MVFIWLLIETTGTDMTRNRIRVRGSDMQQRAPRPGLKREATAARTKFLHMACPLY